jgi:hypothetical protein
MSELFTQMGIRRTQNSKNAGIYIPCGYTGVERELHQLIPTSGQIILAINGCDQIVAKNGLWKVLSEKYGRKEASRLTPLSYIIPTDMLLLEKEYDPHQIYILKKNVQRQQGLLLSKNLLEILDSKSSGYVIVQKYLMNPLLIDNRKFDMRVYLLVIQDKKGMKKFYRHKSGRCHYTSKNFTTTSLDTAIHIPTGYIEDNEFKNTHPETLQEMQSYLNGNSREMNGDLFFSRLDRLLEKCCLAFNAVLGINTKKDITYCQLFGIDILSNNQLQPLLIEINKGPEMAWNTKVEHQYKKKLLEDMFDLIGYNSQSSQNDFILLNV